MIKIDNVSEANEIIDILTKNNIDFSYWFDHIRSNTDNSIALFIKTNNKDKKEYIKPVTYSYFSKIVQKLFKKNNIISEYDILIECKDNKYFFKPYSLLTFMEKYAKKHDIEMISDSSLDAYVLIKRKENSKNV